MDEKLAAANRLSSGSRAVALVCAVVLAAIGAVAAHAFDSSPVNSPPPAAVATAVRSNSGPPGFADIVDAVRPAVIGVQSKAADPADQDVATAPFHRFFPEFEGPPSGRRNGAVSAVGSGFFISADGYAVTNYHVIEGSATVIVQTDEQKSYSAKVVGVDQVSDLALLKVDGRDDFSYVELAQRAPRVGDWVLAVGNPFGLGGTVTAGIVSARERNIGRTGAENYIQIDAPINKGDSGGPSFDIDGKVIGVNTMIVSPSGGSIGIAFAVPAETVTTVIPQLRENGSVTRGWLGVQMQQITPEIREALGLGQAQGALVSETEADGPAAKAGILPGDVIDKVAGRAIKDTSELSKTISSTSPGTSVELHVLQPGGEKTVTVAVGTFPNPRQAQSTDKPPATGKPPETTGRGGGALPLGLKLAPANVVAGAGKSGVVVVAVDPNGVAADQGFERGDVILEVGGKSVNTPGEVHAALNGARNTAKRSVVMRLKSGEATRFVAVPVG